MLLRVIGGMACEIVCAGTANDTAALRKILLVASMMARWRRVSVRIVPMMTILVFSEESLMMLKCVVCVYDAVYNLVTDKRL